MIRIFRSLRSLTLLATCLAVPLGAQEIERLPPRSGPDLPTILPSLADTRNARRTQLVWDAGTGRMTRRPFVVWNPMPGEDLEFRWEPAAGTEIGEGAVSGMGRVLWLTSGAASYDHDAVVAEFDGRFEDGRLTGTGRYKHRSGIAYRGEWRNGVMHGQGELSLPDGDVYVGSFREGKLHGEGVYIETSGTVYRGGYLANERDGDGTLTYASGEVLAAAWRAGEEVAGTRRRVSPPRKAERVQYRTYDDLSLGVIVDRRFAPVHLGPDQPLHYTSSSTPEVTQIYPDYPRLLEIWRGTGNLRLNRSESYQAWNSRRYESLQTFLGLGEARVEPVPLIFEFENRTNGQIHIQTVYLDVGSSETDTDPAVQLLIDASSECDPAVDWQYNTCTTLFHFENYGWSNPVDASLNFTFDGRTQFRQEIGTFEHRYTARFEEELARLGVNFNAFQRRHVCTAQSVRGLERAEACKQDMARDPDFGQIADQVVFGAALEDANPNTVGVIVRGTLDYRWQQADGTWREKSSPFDGYVALANLPDGVEVGEGGDPEPIGHAPFKFTLDQSNYRIPLPLNAHVDAGISGRWKLELEADRSSNHDFRVVFVLADGRRVSSRQMSMLYVRPRVFPDN